MKVAGVHPLPAIGNYLADDEIVWSKACTHTAESVVDITCALHWQYYFHSTREFAHSAAGNSSQTGMNTSQVNQR